MVPQSLFSRWRNKGAAVEEVEDEDESFEPFVCRKCGKLIDKPGFEVCPQAG